MLQAQVDLVPVSVATVPHGASRCGDPAGAGVARGPARGDIGLMSSVACHSRLRPGRRGRVVSPAWRPRATLALAAFLVLLLTALPLASARAQSMPEALGGMLRTLHAGGYVQEAAQGAGACECGPCALKSLCRNAAQDAPPLNLLRLTPRGEQYLRRVTGEQP